ncbi:sensor histidine kinase [Streptomyces sp. NPDC059828]|uniref:sensor histidine kinase n=1 Tax=Streptomyces sp. NPDC059828 TaxID=3346965 RepID=UPI00364D90FA
MSRLTGWWNRRGNAAKVELYTRWSFHTFVLVEVFTIGLATLGRQGGRWPVSLPVTLLVCVHAVLSGVLSSRALDWRLGRRPRPLGTAAALGLLTGTSTLTVLVTGASGAVVQFTPVTVVTVTTGLVSFGCASLVLCLNRVRHMIWFVLATVTVTTAIACALALPAPAAGTGGFAAPEALGIGVGTLMGATGISFTYAFSAWLLSAVWELDRARELQTRLAVAEERLRFGRDLHDVMGRNLAVIALKSELAVQLAQRGATEQALAEMTEVQRIARESQREVRDVVRGYREADLSTELEGARGVLTAAGIDCLIDSRDVGPPDAGLPVEVQSALAWVVREATTNVLRHGDAEHCAIRLGVGDGSAVLTVENDGARDTVVPGPGGTGLAGLRERLAALDGTLDASRAGRDGFRLTARVPLAPRKVRTPESAGTAGTGGQP